MRVSLLRAALAPTFRATPLIPAAVACVLACVPPFLVGHPREVIGALIGVALLTSVGVGFALDDPAAVTLEASPTPLAVRRGMRLALLGVVLTAGAVVHLSIASVVGEGVPIPARAWLVECGAFVVVTLAVSALAQRVLPELSGGAAAAPAGLVLLACVGTLSRFRSWLSPFPGAEHWPRWWLVLAAAAAALAWLSRDPASRALRS